MASAFAMLRLLPMSDRDMDVEVLALRHQIAVLERQLNGQQPHPTQHLGRQTLEQRRQERPCRRSGNFPLSGRRVGAPVPRF
ncbi:hypothetical protein [Streptomyces galilaeus]